jgi:hypothetical protein
MSEKQDCSFVELLSKIGGALGLMLGLSLVDIVIFTRKIRKFNKSNNTFK